MLLTLDDFEPAARRRLPRPLFGYVSGAAETGAARQDNRAALDAWRLVPKVLAGVEGRSVAQNLMGKTYTAPFGIAPMGLSALMARDGDRVLARAAGAAGLPFVLSGSSLTRMEDVRDANPDAWFQAYLPGEEDRIRALIARAREAGFGTLVLTADTAVVANRENNLRAGFSTPLRVTPRLLWDFAIKPRWVLGTFVPTLARGMPHFENSDAIRGAPIISKQAMRDFGRKDHLSWDHLALMRDLWPGKLVLKGVIAPDDVGRARALGCDGVVLSNHGGRQLDHAISPLRILPEARAQAGDMALLVDGGIRRGTDVIKALALGADMVLVGRPLLYAATLGGQEMATRAIDILKTEIHRNLGLLGLRSLSEVGPDILHRV
ncbi:L-lactate dehydrogenase (cytochrome) [Pseudooceanicola antarcticus]|uniref:Alpha-hydroxy-acid oxidizing protein n=1 Tax=Pseudooceanicola antarcticus TaxID=1247613 RepID=A0A285J5J0_9RHOB|nr:alpha-hydroxy acid oxidase [Pseudooceanicola antarcticus]PJE26867.1 alpha-hydroxy-acid oxidizing protein [Pseudooceanicola antarcticus]SNY55589.1 L-lactate dehydrogenase (cytochrome) [Pseudooceanicola antarcticus]